MLGAPWYSLSMLYTCCRVTPILRAASEAVIFLRRRRTSFFITIVGTSSSRDTLVRTDQEPQTTVDLFSKGELHQGDCGTLSNPLVDSETNLEGLAVSILGRNCLDPDEENACVRSQTLKALLEALGLRRCSVTNVVRPSHAGRESHRFEGVN